MMNNVLNCQKISFQFSRQPLFQNLTFNLKASESLCVIGENGSGKTTLLKVLAGLLKPTNGTVHCLNELLWPQNQSSFEHKSIYLAYKPAFYENLSVTQNLIFSLDCYNQTYSFHDLESALQRVSLFSLRKNLVESLSSGQKRRLTLAVLLLLKPNLVLIDEPTNGLDEIGTKLCFEIFNELMQISNTSFVIASHDKNAILWCQKSLNLQEFKISPVKTESQKHVSLDMF